MRQTLTALAATAIVGFGSSPAMAADDFTIQLKWVAQAQFAGYFVAEDMGFYDDVDLDVTIRPGGPDVAPEQVIAGGAADAIVNWLPSALAAREKGLPLVNIAQFFTRAGNNITCLKSSGIAEPTDFKGKTIGVIYGGNEFPFLAWMSQLGLKVSGADADITTVRQGFNVDPILNKQADCVSTQIYNEYYQILDAGVPADELVTFFFADYGVATLEDGLYTTEDKLSDPEEVDKLVRFVKASIKGWTFAMENPEEAARIVVENDPAGVADLAVQTRQMLEISKLISGSSKGLGYLEPEAFDTTVDVLLSGSVDPIITAAPEGAWTHEIFEMAVADE